jgi:hypothetical protein
VKASAEDDAEDDYDVPAEGDQPGDGADSFAREKPRSEPEGQDIEEGGVERHLLRGRFVGAIRTPPPKPMCWLTFGKPTAPVVVLGLWTRLTGSDLIPQVLFGAPRTGRKRGRE